MPAIFEAARRSPCFIGLLPGGRGRRSRTDECVPRQSLGTRGLPELLMRAVGLGTRERWGASWNGARARGCLLRDFDEANFVGHGEEMDGLGQVDVREYLLLQRVDRGGGVEEEDEEP